MRLFVAVFPPEDVRDHLYQHVRAALGRAGRAARLTPVHRWHVTVKFVGEVPAERLPDAERALDGIRPPGEIVLRMSGGGSFGTGRSTALWAGIDGDLDALAVLHADVQRALATANLPYDERPLTPHLTIAHARSADLREALTNYAGPTWTAAEMVLVRSNHGAGGGYDNLRGWPLG